MINGDDAAPGPDADETFSDDPKFDQPDGPEFDQKVMEANWRQLTERHPELAVRSMKIPGWRSEHHYFIDHPAGIVFKFAGDNVGAFRMPAQTELLTKLARQFPIALPAPPPEYVFNTSKEWPERFVGYHRLPDGYVLPNEELRQESGVTKRVAALIGDALSRLHATPTDEFQDIELLLGVDADDTREILQALIEVVDEVELFPRDEDRSRFEKFLGGFVDDAANFRWRPTLLHGDFFNGVVTDKRQRSIEALWNWGDAHIGDPAWDLSLSVYHFGPAFGRSVLANYRGGESPTALWRRMIFYLHIETLGDALEAAVLEMLGARVVEDEDAAGTRDAKVRAKVFAAQNKSIVGSEPPDDHEYPGVNGFLQILADADRYMAIEPVAPSDGAGRRSLLEQMRAMTDRARASR